MGVTAVVALSPGGVVARAAIPGGADVTTNDGVENVTFRGADGNLYFYWQADDGSWVQELVDTYANL